MATKYDQLHAYAVTVALAAYNSAATLECALASVVKQSLEDFEVWVVGDGCTDDSEAVVAGFKDPRINWVNLSSNSGSQSGPNNEAIRRAGGKYIAYIGQDDLWLPWHLANLHAALEETGADFARSLAVTVPRDGDWRLWGEGPITDDYASFATPVSWMHRRDLIERIGGWSNADQGYLPVDFHLQRRAVRAGARFAAAPELSVVKFGSPVWGAYGLANGYPQPDYLQRLIEDPRALQAQLLDACAESKARRPPPVPGRIWLLRMRRRLGDLIGRDWWPMSKLHEWRFQRGRRRIRPSRGMPP